MTVPTLDKRLGYRASVLVHMCPHTYTQINICQKSAISHGLLVLSSFIKIVAHGFSLS